MLLTPVPERRPTRRSIPLPAFRGTRQLQRRQRRECAARKFSSSSSSSSSSLSLSLSLSCRCHRAGCRGDKWYKWCKNAAQCFEPAAPQPSAAPTVEPSAASIRLLTSYTGACAAGTATISLMGPSGFCYAAGCSSSSNNASNNEEVTCSTGSIQTIVNTTYPAQFGPGDIAYFFAFADSACSILHNESSTLVIKVFSPPRRRAALHCTASTNKPASRPASHQRFIHGSS